MAKRDDEEAIQRALDEYHRYKTKLDERKETAEKAVRSALSGIDDVTIFARVKAPDSFERKLRNDVRRPIEDTVGVRVLVPFRSDIDWVLAALFEPLVIKTGSFVDKATANADDEFGYRSASERTLAPAGRALAGPPDAPPETTWCVMREPVRAGTLPRVSLRFKYPRRLNCREKRQPGRLPGATCPANFSDPVALVGGVISPISVRRSARGRCWA